MAKKFECNYKCNEIEISRNFLSFSDDDIRSFIYYMTFTKQYNQRILSLIIKYLVHIEKIKPEDIEDIIRKYSIILIYSFLKDKYNYKNILFFDEILEKDISIEALKSIPQKSNNALIELYLKEKSTNYYEYIIKLEREIFRIKEMKNKIRKTIINLLIKDNHFFTSYKKNEMLNLKNDNRRSFDQLIAESIENRNFIDIDIEITEANFQNYKKNFIHFNSDKNLKSKYLIFIALLTFDLIENNNYDLSKKIDLNIFYNTDILSLDKRNKLKGESGKILNFIDFDGNILDKNIHTFQYILNGIKYELSSNGLKIVK